MTSGAITITPAARSVTLSWGEIWHGADVGARRRLFALRDGRRQRYGNNDGLAGWDMHIAGAIAELAACKYAGLYWPGSTSPDYEGDIGPGLQVRSTWRPDGCLILHDGDNAGHTFVLVTGAPPTYRIRGAILAEEGQREKYWRSDVPNAAYFVPQVALGPWPG
jgi:hypothetical protein